jgi:hypothetical protein
MIQLGEDRLSDFVREKCREKSQIQKSNVFREDLTCIDTQKAI